MDYSLFFDWTFNLMNGFADLGTWLITPLNLSGLGLGFITPLMLLGATFLIAFVVIAIVKWAIS